MLDSSQASRAPAPFVTTHWSVILAAKNKASPDSFAALETLCHIYWYPVYVFVRRQGHSPADAEDLTQEFFARFLAKDYLQAADREKGRFRTFVRVALKRFLANEWERARRLKRGGGLPQVSLDTACAEQRYQAESSVTLSPERLYEQRWARTLLDQALSELRSVYAEAGKEFEFEQLKGALTAERESIDYHQLSETLKMNEGAVRVAVHRLRKQFRQVFRSVVAQTVAIPQEVDQELRYLAKLLTES